VTSPVDEELPATAPRSRWRWALYALAALALATFVALRLAGGSATEHPAPSPVPQAVVESLVPSPTVEPFCSTISPCTLEHTVSGLVATALADDAHATLVSAETYLSAGIQLTVDSLQSRRLEARAGAVSLVVDITVKLGSVPPPPAIGAHDRSITVATVRADLGRFVVDVVAIGATVPSRQELGRLAHDQRLLAVG
jgi:hypothetical protein